MNRTKLPIRKRLENVPQFSGSVDAAVAEEMELVTTRIPDPGFGGVTDIVERKTVTTRIPDSGSGGVTWIPDPGFGGVTEMVSEPSVINLIDDVTGTPNPEVEKRQRDDVLLLIGDWIVDLIERPNAGPDDVHIEDVAVEDVVLEGIVAREDPVEDPDKNE
ncbi:hypothetical protein AgCh_025252 [Apium graveolens]